MRKMATMGNLTTIQYSDVDHWDAHQFIKTTYVVLFSLSTFIGVLGNFVILWAFVASRALRALRNAFIVNLTIADLAVATVTMPMSIIGAVVGKPWFEERHSICMLSAMICAPGCIAATYSIFAVAASKYYYICRYRQYLKYFTGKRVAIYILLIWLVSFSVHVPNHIGWGTVHYSAHFQFCTFDSHHHSYPLFYASTIGLAIVSTAVFYTKLYYRIRKTNLPRQLLLGLKPKKATDEYSRFKYTHSPKSTCSSLVFTANESTAHSTTMLVLSKEEIAVSTSPTGSTSNMFVRRKKFTDELRLITASFKIFLLFLIMWSPVVIVILFFRDQNRWNVPEALYLFTALMAHSNSTCNVFIYFCANCSFRKFIRSKFAFTFV